MMFWDASALIPLCIDEPSSKTLRSMARKEGAIVVWWGTLIECLSAFSRLRRENILDLSTENQVRRLLKKLATVWTEIQPSEEIRQIAGRLLLAHPLRAADSLQLAAALIWADKNPQEHLFVCLDKRLRDAAQREGFALMPSAERFV